MLSLTRRAARILAVAVPALAAAGIAVPAGAPERGPVRRSTPVASAADTDEARVIVKYRADSTLMQALAVKASSAGPQQASALSARLGLALADGRAIGGRAQVVRATGLGSQALADRLAAQPDVEYAVVDRPVSAYALPNDPLYPAGSTARTPVVGQWYLRPPTSSTIVDATSVVSSINAEAAWNITTGSAGVVVAVLDTGVRRDHPDLAPKLLAGYDFVGDTAISADGDGRDADPSDPGDYSGSDTSSWHGTQTAGLVGAATNNGVGMASVGRDVMVLPVRVLGKGGVGHSSDIQAAMLWAAGVTSVPTVNPNPAKVINLSLGSTGSCDASYADVVRQLSAANVTVVAAAGNDGLAVGVPANCAGVIGVAGVRHAGTKVGYSDLGPEIAIAAPAGNCVNSTGTCLFPLLTTSNSGTTVPVSDANGGSVYTSGGSDASLGTSFSSPLVAGTVGLMLSAHPGLTPAQVLAALRSTARPFPATGAGSGVAACTAPTAAAQPECYCTTSTCGAGLLDAGAAVAAVAQASATIGAASTALVAGTAVTLDGSGSKASGGAAITGYQWAITSGGAFASLTSSTNASTVTLLPSAAGTVVVSLTVTDSAGKQAVTSTSFIVAAASTAPATPTTPAPTTPTPTTPAPTTGSSSSGGGALDPVWLIAWLAAIAAVRAVVPAARPTRRSQPSQPSRPSRSSRSSRSV